MLKVKEKNIKYIETTIPYNEDEELVIECIMLNGSVEKLKLEIGKGSSNWIAITGENSLINLKQAINEMYEEVYKNA